MGSKELLSTQPGCSDADRNAKDKFCEEVQGKRLENVTRDGVPLSSLAHEGYHLMFYLGNKHRSDVVSGFHSTQE